MKKCHWCDEPILRHEQHYAGQANKHQGCSDFHYECFFRMFVGSVGHVRKECSCWGGKAGDPPGMTRREAAKAAFEEYHRLNPGL